MVLDPFSALGLAGNIVQFVQFGSDVFGKSREIAKAASGASLENEELGSAVQRLEKICLGLQRSQSQRPGVTSTSSDTDSLQELAESCRTAGEEILRALLRFKAEGSNKKWQSFGKALKTVWKKSEIQAMEKRLGSYRDQLMSHLSALQE